MSDDIELVNAGEYLNKLCADMSASKSYYYDIQYTLSTTLLEYRLKHSLNSKDMASYFEVIPSMLYNYESGDYDFYIYQIFGYKDFGCFCKDSCVRKKTSEM